MRFKWWAPEETGVNMTNDKTPTDHVNPVAPVNLSDEDFQEIVEDVKAHTSNPKPMTLLEYARNQADKGLEYAEKEVTRLEGVLEDYKQRSAEYIKSLEDALEEAKLVHKTHKASVSMLNPPTEVKVEEDKPALPPVSTLPAASGSSSKKVTNGNK